MTNNPSICIPRVYKNISYEHIKNIFENKLAFGYIKKIDMIPIQNDNVFKKVFIHFKYWNDSSEHVKQLFLEGAIVKIVYDDPWFWKCSINKITM